MSLPGTVRVKLSSEAAEFVSLTPVVVRDLPIRELIEHMLGITGKDEERVRDLLLRGTLVSGASRFRWPGLEADGPSIRQVLATFPDPEPARPFAPGQCIRAILRGGRNTIDIPRDAGLRKPLFRRRAFWDLLMEVAAQGDVRYVGYSYKERADWYRVEFSMDAAVLLRSASETVKYSTLRERIRTERFVYADLFVQR